MSMTPPLARLIEAFQSLPGVGPKSAQRLAFHMLKQSRGDVEHFSRALVDAKERVKECSRCFYLTSEALCAICMNPQRKQNQLCVVAEASDVMALERSGGMQGGYHVLHGLISPLDGISPDDLRIRELLERLQPQTDDGMLEPEGNKPAIEEVILALPPSIEGDTTSLYLAKLIKPLGITLSRIAFGLPVGGDLEYADQLTITRALEGRQLI